MNERTIKHERDKTDYERYLKFEHSLRFCLSESNEKTDREDDFLLDDIKQAIVVYTMKDKFKENNEVFLSNMEHDFYRAIEKLEEKHQDQKDKLSYIKLFMEDFYFKQTL